MTAQETQKYLEACMECELSIYTLDNTINQLYRQYRTLGNKKTIYAPTQKKTDIAETFFSIAPTAGVICAIIQAIAAFICELDGSFFGFLAAVWVAVVLAAFAFLGCGVIIGTIGTIIVVIRQKKHYKQEYEASLVKYDKNIKNDKARVALENHKKKALGAEIQSLQSYLNRSKKHLSKIYSYNIVAPDYRNIYAISSFYGYFANGRTKCLHFNEATGDQGAYNIYENERRLDKIITNTEEIINRLDEVIHNQYYLANGLQKATQRINSLCGSVNSHMKKISNTLNSIERCQSIIAYNTEMTTRELEFNNWMNVLYS